MCVIIIKNNQDQFDAEVAKNASEINPHGLGVVWLDDWTITYHKSSEHHVLHTNRPFIAHFRYATVGKVGRSNTHPFQCGPMKHEYLMQNGTIYGLGNHNDCDSKLLAQMLGRKVKRDKWADELGKHDSRFVTINVKAKTYQIYNKSLWVKKNGVWYSKGNVVEDNFVAVYGTLKRGNGNYNRYLKESKFVGSGKTAEKYPMIVKSLPYVIHDPGVGHNIVVDVFRVTDTKLASLDQLEGHPTWYERKKTAITLDDGSEVMCWLYFNPTQYDSTDKLHDNYVAPVYNYGNSYGGGTYRTNYGSMYGDPLEDIYDDWWGYTKPRKVNKLPSTAGLFRLKQNTTDTKTSIDLCPKCYQEVKHDGWENYYCSPCDTWFAEKEVL